MEQELSLKQLEKLEANPAYKLSEKQIILLARYRSKQFNTNNKFKKHDEGVDGKPNND